METKHCNCGELATIKYNRKHVCTDCYEEFNNLLINAKNLLYEAEQHMDTEFLKAVNRLFTNIPPIPELDNSDWNELLKKKTKVW